MSRIICSQIPGVRWLVGPNYRLRGAENDATREEGGPRSEASAIGDNGKARGSGAVAAFGAACE